jgi:hypothetical protein
MFSFSVEPRFVTGRGCSTKDKVFYKECETHQSDQVIEKLCFCSYYLCNGSSNLIKTGPKNVFTLVWFIILVVVLNRLLLNTLDYTKYHVCHNKIFKGKNKAKKQLVVSKETSKSLEMFHPNQITVMEHGRRMILDRWKYGYWKHSSFPLEIVIISEFYNDRNLTKEPRQAICHLFNDIISLYSENLLDLASNECERLIKRAQKGCQPSSYDEYTSTTERSPLASKIMSHNDASLTCTPFEGRKMKTVPLMPTHLALEPVTAGS